MSQEKRLVPALTLGPIPPPLPPISTLKARRRSARVSVLVQPPSPDKSTRSVLGRPPGARNSIVSGELSFEEKARLARMVEEILEESTSVRSGETVSIWSGQSSRAYVF